MRSCSYLWKERKEGGRKGGRREREKEGRERSKKERKEGRKKKEGKEGARKVYYIFLRQGNERTCLFSYSGKELANLEYIKGNAFLIKFFLCAVSKFTSLPSRFTFVLT